MVAGDVSPKVHEVAAPGRAVSVVADVSRREGAEALVAAAETAFGGLDVLFSNAGIERQATVVDTTEELWHEVLDANLKSVFLCAKYAIPAMLRRARGCDRQQRLDQRNPREHEPCRVPGVQGRGRRPDLLHRDGLRVEGHPL